MSYFRILITFVVFKCFERLTAFDCGFSQSRSAESGHSDGKAFALIHGWKDGRNENSGNSLEAAPQKGREAIQ
ncbi:hypothetical protein CD175_11955 [Pseudomonas laurylsulfatiphila]|uniref:Uncharacterized protein n=1 Tax=Pseudomonas laurylsulfatiphila TaxID=2011015 RepID=A0A2S6FM57_9PSED|nr:hypothetical protein CD175_11955 [Pseudomonas laurylsulfatiphila]